MFYLLTPDGFTINEEAKLYTNKDDAYTDFCYWQQQYLIQGYYASAKHGNIPLGILWKYMHFHDKPFLNVHT